MSFLLPKKRGFTQPSFSRKNEEGFTQPTSLKKKLAGFTLIEILIVVGIIGILAAVVLASLGEARKSARDKQRVSDLQQIQVALRQYKDLNGTYPNCQHGMNIGEGGTPQNPCVANINVELSPYFPSIPSDPQRQNGVGDPYEYIYNSEVQCTAIQEQGSDRYAVVFARSMEKASSANWSNVCNANTTNPNSNPTATSYGIVLGKTK